MVVPRVRRRYKQRASGHRRHAAMRWYVARRRALCSGVGDGRVATRQYPPARAGIVSLALTGGETEGVKLPSLEVGANASVVESNTQKPRVSLV